MILFEQPNNSLHKQSSGAMKCVASHLEAIYIKGKENLMRINFRIWQLRVLMQMEMGPPQT